MFCAKIRPGEDHRPGFGPRVSKSGRGRRFTIGLLASKRRRTAPKAARARPGSVLPGQNAPRRQIFLCHPLIPVLASLLRLPSRP